ncbi:hypothetical protein [Vibrio parahaemolyticus]|uniref:hypothetical protein n=1 Tax=Vibrio parahaemolyticus TaxID=670 RepID=UPI000C99D990|nr:hypothetical protein [Vibrio parahaemolyticus]
MKAITINKVDCSSTDGCNQLLDNNMNQTRQLHILEHPYYMYGAFKSQASNIVKYQPKTTLKLACYTASVANFIKSQDARCFCSLDKLLSTYNSLAPLFNLKQIKKSTFCSIQQTALDSGLVKRETIEHSKTAGRNYRLLSIDIVQLSKQFPSIFALASRRATQRHNRKLESNGDSVNNNDKPSYDKASQDNVRGKIWTITTKRSKDQNNKNKTLLSSDFYKKRFGIDATEAKSLQESARTNSISAPGALKLIKLHAKHSVNLAESFRKYLLWAVHVGKGLSKKEKTATASGNLEFARKTQHLIDSGLGEHRIDRHGSLYVKYFDGTKNLTQALNEI